MLRGRIAAWWNFIERLLGGIRTNYSISRKVKMNKRMHHLLQSLSVVVSDLSLDAHQFYYSQGLATKPQWPRYRRHLNLAHLQSLCACVSQWRMKIDIYELGVFYFHYTHPQFSHRCNERQNRPDVIDVFVGAVSTTHSIAIRIYKRMCVCMYVCHGEFVFLWHVEHAMCVAYKLRFHVSVRRTSVFFVLADGRGFDAFQMNRISHDLHGPKGDCSEYLTCRCDEDQRLCIHDARGVACHILLMIFKLTGRRFVGMTTLRR